MRRRMLVGDALDSRSVRAAVLLVLIAGTAAACSSGGGSTTTAPAGGFTPADVQHATPARGAAVRLTVTIADKQGNYTFEPEKDS
jgi:hypothetical protein